MKTTLAFVLLCSIFSYAADVTVTSEGKSPNTYAVLTQERAEQQLLILKNADLGQARNRSITAAAFARNFKTNKAIPVVPLLPGRTFVSAPPAAKSAVQAVLDQVITPQYRGALNGYQYVELYGSFPSGDKLKLNCDNDIVNGPAPVSFVSLTQINLQIRNAFADTLSCQLNDAADKKVFSFTVPPVSCSDDPTFCSGKTRATYRSTTSDGKPITIPIRDGIYADATFGEIDGGHIAEYLKDVPQDHLRNVSFIQAAGKTFRPARYYSIPDTYGVGAKDGGIFLKTNAEGFSLDILNDVAHGIGSQLFNHLSESDRAVFDDQKYNHFPADYVDFPRNEPPELMFDLIYTDWFKNENYSLFPIFNSVASPYFTPRKQVQLMTMVLAMASQFYDAKTNAITRYGLPYRTPISTRVEFTADALKLYSTNASFVSPWILRLSGNSILSITDPNGKTTTLPNGTSIPDIFLRTVPRT